MDRIASKVLWVHKTKCKQNKHCRLCIHCEVITPVTIKAAMRSIKKFAFSKKGCDIDTALSLCAALYMLISETQMKHNGRISNAKVYIYGSDAEPVICFHTRNYTGSIITGSKYRCSFGCVKRYDWNAKLWDIICLVAIGVAKMIKAAVSVTLGITFPHKKALREPPTYPPLMYDTEEEDEIFGDVD